MHAGLGQWWLHKGILNLRNLVIFNSYVYMFALCLGFLVDTLFCVKWLARLSIFIHVDILVLVNEFVVVVILSEWWSVLTTANHCAWAHP